MLFGPFPTLDRAPESFSRTQRSGHVLPERSNAFQIYGYCLSLYAFSACRTLDDIPTALDTLGENTQESGCYHPEHQKL